MNIYISADGEGISSLVSGAEMHPSGKEYEFGRRMMTADVNAAIAGAFASGATRVVVNDAHWSETNILPHELDPRAELLRGSPKPLSMMHGIEEGFDAAFFVGYHGRVGGSSGVANETIFGREIYDVRINGQPVGELEINAALATHFGVPVVLLTGDDQLAREARDVLPTAETAIVKYAIERWSARCLSPSRAHAIIEEKAAEAIMRLKREERFQPFQFSFPLVCEVEFISTAQAAGAALMPGAERRGARTAAFRAADAAEAWRAILAMMILGARATEPYYG